MRGNNWREKKKKSTEFKTVQETKRKGGLFSVPLSKILMLLLFIPDFLSACLDPSFDSFFVFVFSRFFFFLPRTISQWLNLCFDMYSLCEGCFAQPLATTDIIVIGPACMLRKIFSMKNRPAEAIVSIHTQSSDCWLSFYSFTPLSFHFFSFILFFFFPNQIPNLFQKDLNLELAFLPQRFSSTGLLFLQNHPTLRPLSRYPVLERLPIPQPLRRQLQAQF